MNLQQLLHKTSEHLNHQLPFVLFRKPDLTKITGYFQKDRALNILEEGLASGFVFASFDIRDKRIFFPKHKSEKASIDYIDNVSYSIKNEGIIVIKNISDFQKENHIQLVTKAITEIRSGGMEKVVVSRKEILSIDKMEPITLFQQLLKNYPTALVYIWYHPQVGMWLGATPETLLSISGDQLTTMALAGTQPYIDTLDVKWGAKEKEEQSLVTRDIVSNLKPVSENIETGALQTHKAGKLLHLKTLITAKLKKQSSISEIIEKLHPTPAVCGFPKSVAFEFIKKEESYDREFYTGYLGEIEETDEKKSAELYVNLRCMQIFENQAFIYVGGGITKDSDPESEWEETVRKTETMKKVFRE